MAERCIFNKSSQKRRHATLLKSVGLLWVIVAGFVIHDVYAQDAEPVLIDPNAAANSPYSETLTDISFKRMANGTGVTTLSFAEEALTPQLIESKGKVTLTLPKTELGEDQLAKIDVSQFATAVSYVETFQDEKSARVEVVYTGDVAARYDRNNNQLNLYIRPLTEEETAALQQQTTYTGTPISLDFQDVPVRQVLQIIAQVNGFNLVTTDTVTGNVTISLAGVPWDQALAMILKIKGLDKRLEGNILLIAPAEELSARETADLASKQQVAELQPLRSQTIAVNYAKAEELSTILRSSEGGILSERGTVSVDERTNTILVRDTQESIDEARKLIESLDIPVKQVLIESRMVTVRDNVQDELGVRWGFSDRQDDNGISGSLEGADVITTGTVPVLGDRLNVNLPVTSAAGRIGFQVANLVDGTILDLELSALEAENKGEVIASPRITVANQQEAYIEQGTEIPYVQASSSGATNVTFKKAVLSLKVTPHITPDNRIILDLVVTQDTRGDTVSTSTGPAVAIDTQEIKTQVLVENGETVVLGGIFQQTQTNDVNKVPLFGDLPVVGALFRNSSKVYQKRELLIFVTPKIVTEDF